DEVITDFVATVAGTYTARVSGAAGAYSLVVTRNADFDAEANNTLAQAQSLFAGGAGRLWALGHVGDVGVPTDSRVLYFSDVSPAGADPYLQALANLGITPTVVPQSSTAAPDTYPQLVTQLTAGGWDLVIFQQRFWFSDTVVTPLVNYLNAGGRSTSSTLKPTPGFPPQPPALHP